MRKFLLLGVLLLASLGFIVPSPNDAALEYNIDLLRAHPETAACVDWMQARGVRFGRYAVWDTYAILVDTWAAFTPDQITYPPIVNRDAATAAVIVHELGHLQGYPDPEAYTLQRWAARILGVPKEGEAGFDWIDEQEAIDKDAYGLENPVAYYRPFLGYGDEGEPIFESWSSKALSSMGRVEVLPCSEW